MAEVEKVEDRAAPVLPFQRVAEVQEVSPARANEYLARGYVLLGIYATARLVSRGPGDTGGGFIRKGTVYVVARPAEVAHWEPAARVAS